MRTRLAFASSLAVLLAGGLAASPSAADIAPPGLDGIECPAGAIPTLPVVDPDARDARGRPIRPWPYCAPSTCASDADCADGRTCSEEEIGLCVEDVEVSGQTVRAPRRRGCEPDGTCLNIDSTCERSRRCVGPADADVDEDVEEANEAIDEAHEALDEAREEAAEAVEEAEEPEASGCGCRVDASSSGAPWGLAALLIGVALLRRRA